MPRRGPDNRLLDMRVLYVDDDIVNLRVVQEMLHAADIPVDCVDGGREALSVLAEQPYDVVLMDIHMPGMTGLECLAELRAAPGPNRDALVIALTADLSRSEAEYQALGFRGLLAKPITLRALLAALLDAMAARMSHARLQRSA